MRSLAKALVPARMRDRLHQYHHSHVLARALRQFAANPAAALDNRELICRLIFGWGNNGWVCSPDYLEACIRETLSTTGPILECGSGLTTVVVGVIANRTGRSLHALEHEPRWCQTVQAELQRLRLASARVYPSPLEDYGAYTWYAVPPSVSAERFGLVLCDGPPASTPGGRYGLLPTLRNCLRPECIVLLDDAIRADEQAIAHRWQKEGPMACRAAGTDAPYFRLVSLSH